MAARPLPPAEYLRECLTYDPETGSLTWRASRPREHFRTERGWRSWTAKQGGKIAGNVEPNGYRVVMIDYRTYKTHRLIWIMQKGNAPTVEIDHRNGDKADNRWCNLREATKQQNIWNSRQQRSLPKGVYYMPRQRRYLAKVTYEGTEIYLGYFETPEAAGMAFDSYVRPYRGEFFRSRKEPAMPAQTYQDDDKAN